MMKPPHCTRRRKQQKIRSHEWGMMEERKEPRPQKSKSQEKKRTGRRETPFPKAHGTKYVNLDDDDDDHDEGEEKEDGGDDPPEEPRDKPGPSARNCCSPKPWSRLHRCSSQRPPAEARVQLGRWSSSDSFSAEFSSRVWFVRTEV